jgi:asparagine synthase (glutamine-hydrolysing)
MCGIAGILNARGEAVDAAPLGRMVGTIRHRGPDASGVWRNGPIALGHARLAIIDLVGGVQPMANAEGSVCISYNGEIFNYIELRQELIARGHRFETQSDTEVILRLYEDKGEACVDDLNGQFAFAIWDGRERKLFLARDRLGIRPLYYTRREGQLLFASEIKALFAHPVVRREIDLRALDQIFTLWCTLPSRTIFEDIQALPPGHCMRVADGRVDVWRYWKLDYTRDLDEPVDEEARAEKLRELLVDATRLRLRSDVPVGAYLSGGLDSSVIVGLVRNFTSNRLETFSVAFEDAEFDERAFQKEVSAHLGTDHHTIDCHSEDIGTVFPEVTWHAETPIVRTAPSPLFMLSGLVQKSGFKVVLTGEGADEVLGGYDIFKEAKLRRFWARCPDSKLRPLLLRRLYPYLKNIQTQPDAYRKAFFHVRPEELASPFFSHLSRWDLTARLKLFFSSETKAELEGYDVFEELHASLPAEFSSWDHFAQAQYLETTLLMPGYILSSQGDRMSMGHSVEGRFPFLDHRVVEFAAKLPPQLKMKVLEEKYLLKRAAGDLIPASVTRRKKQPYRAPEAVSLLGDAEGRRRPSWVDAVLSIEQIERDGLFNPLAVDKLLRKFERGRAIGIRDNMAVVGITSTQLVLDRFIHHFRS